MLPDVIVSDFFVAKYDHGEEHARHIAKDAITLVLKNPKTSFGFIFPLSMLDLVPPGKFVIKAVGRPYFEEQGIEEAAFVVSYLS